MDLAAIQNSAAAIILDGQGQSGARRRLSFSIRVGQKIEVSGVRNEFVDRRCVSGTDGLGKAMEQMAHVGDLGNLGRGGRVPDLEWDGVTGAFGNMAEQRELVS